MDNNQNEVPQNTQAEVSATTTVEANKETSNNGGDFAFNEETIMASLSYLGPLVLIPFLTKKDNAFIKFHVKQGLVVLVPEIIIYVLGGMIFMLMPIISLLNLALLVLSIIGIINALQKKEKELPLIGHFAQKINI